MLAYAWVMACQTLEMFLLLLRRNKTVPFFGTTSFRITFQATLRKYFLYWVPGTGKRGDGIWRGFKVPPT